MILKNPNKVRFTRTELNQIRKNAANNGFAVNEIKTQQEALQALIYALPDGIAEDMLRFIETGESEIKTLEDFKARCKRS